MATTFTPASTLLDLIHPKVRYNRLVTNIVTVFLGSLLIAAAAKVSVPVWPVPVTLQSMAIAGLAAAFGMRIGVATVALYLFEGMIGLPVFATGGGTGYLVGPTGGFLLGFLVMAAVIGAAVDRGASARPLSLFAAMLVGDAILMVFGFAWLVLMAGQAGWVDQSDVIGSAFRSTVQPFLVWDALKMAMATIVVAGIWKISVRR